MNGQHLCKNLKDLEKLAKQLSLKLTTPKILVFNGPVGVGKTTFISFLVQHLGNHSVVSSPSFSLVQEYPGTPKVLHMDWYRLESKAAFDLCDFEHYFEKKDCLIFIEWSKRFALNLNAIEIELNFGNQESERVVTIHNNTCS